MSNTHWRAIVDDSNYLASWDFQPGEERVLTIGKVTSEEVFNQTSNSKKMCRVLYFTEKCKPMVLNKTNGQMIEDLCKSGDIEDWIGFSIIVKVEKVKAFGKLNSALRVKKQIPDKRDSKTQILPLCNDCGNDITGYENYSASLVANTTYKRYGVCLCTSCGSKRKQEEEKLNEANE